MPDFETLARTLTTWARNMDAGDRAAVWLLKEHEHWLRRADFTAAAVVKRGTATAVDWRKAREFLEMHPLGSTSQLAVLDLAITLAEDRFRFGIMGRAHAAMITGAVQLALGDGNG
jgi:hypothetical protein